MGSRLRTCKGWYLLQCIGGNTDALLEIELVDDTLTSLENRNRESYRIIDRLVKDLEYFSQKEGGPSRFASLHAANSWLEKHKRYKDE